MAATKAQIKRSRLLADALRGEAMNSAPVGHWTQGLARVLDGAVAGIHDRRADKLEADRSQQLAQALSGGMSPSEMRNYGAVNDFQDELFPMADRREDQQNWQTQFDYGKTKDERDFGYRRGRDTIGDNQWGQQFNAEQGWKEKGFGLQQDQFGLEQDKFDWQKNAPPDPTDDMREYDLYSQQEKAGGRQPVSFFDYQTGIKRAGATNLSNSVNTKAETKYDEERSKYFATSMNDLSTAAQAAGDQLQTFGALRQTISDPNFYSGPASGKINYMRQVAVSFGLADPSQVTSVETFGALTKKAALDNMGGKLGAGFSNADRDFVNGMGANEFTTPEGNLKIIDVGEKTARRKIEIAEMASQYERHFGRIDDRFFSELRSWANQNPLFPKNTDADAAQPGFGLDAVEQELRRRGQQ